MSNTGNIEEVNGVKFTALPIEGVETAEGYFKAMGDMEGTVRIPKSKLRKKKLLEIVDSTPEEVKDEPTAKKKLTLPPINTHGFIEKLVFSTELGEVTGNYYPVIDIDKFLILGLTDASFIPKSFNEAPSLRITVRTKNNEYKIVYTGCRFTEPDLNRDYIILMKVTE